MKPSEMRALLIAQHQGLRELAAEVRVEAQRVLDGVGVSVEALRGHIARLDEALVAHNQEEETLLRDEIRGIDAWGPQREALMDESHAREHTSLVSSLRECGLHKDPHDIARHAQTFVQRVLDHIQIEEKEILHPDLLRDDVVTIQAFGG